MNANESTLGLASDRSLGPLPLRLMLGFGFLYHGIPKLSAAGHQDLVGMMQGIGMPLPELMAWGTGLFEVLGGAMLLAGLWVVPVAAIGIVQMAVAMFTVHLPHGFNFINITGMTEAGPQFGMPGYEVNLLYIAGFLSLMLLGAGAASVDGLLSSETDTDEHADRAGVRPVASV